jgi:hypothetical protein
MHYSLELLYYGKINVQDGDPSYGHLWMVVMQYIDGMMLDEAKRHWHGGVPANNFSCYGARATQGATGYSKANRRGTNERAT